MFCQGCWPEDAKAHNQRVKKQISSDWSSYVKKLRGPYKSYLSTPDNCEPPRQTKHNRKSLAIRNRQLQQSVLDADEQFFL